MLAASMFSHAEIRPGEDGIICLELLDTIVSEGRREEILHYMDEVFCQRFQMDVSFNISYRENDESGSREYDEQRLQEEINSIFERSGYSRKNRTEDGKTAGEAEEQSLRKEKLLRAVFRPEEREYPIPVLCPAQAEADGKKNSKRKTTIVRLRQGMIRI